MTEWIINIFIAVTGTTLAILALYMFREWKINVDQEIKNLKCENARLKCQNAATQVSLNEIESRLEEVAKNED